MIRCPLALGGLILLAACDTGGGGSSTAAGTSASESSDSAGSVSGGELEGFAATCAAQTSRESCEAVPPQQDVNSASGCFWKQWYPVDPKSCVFGEPGPGFCDMTVSGSEGCASRLPCDNAVMGMWRETAVGVEVAAVTSCYEEEICFPDDTDKPGCDCLCEPGLP